MLWPAASTTSCPSLQLPGVQTLHSVTTRCGPYPGVATVVAACCLVLLTTALLLPLRQVCHGEELVFVWHSNGTKYGFDFSPAEDAMSDAMESYWSSMAATGAPGSAGTAYWLVVCVCVCRCGSSLWRVLVTP